MFRLRSHVSASSALVVTTIAIIFVPSAALAGKKSKQQGLSVPEAVILDDEYSNREHPMLPRTVILFDLMNERFAADASMQNELVHALEHQETGKYTRPGRSGALRAPAKSDSQYRLEVGPEAHGTRAAQKKRNSTT